jgi:hypothetical protein
LFDRQFFRFRALKDFANEHSGSPKHLKRTRAIAHQTARDGQVGGGKMAGIE